MKPTLIIVDDSLEMREHLYSLLIEDFEVFAAIDNGKEAVEAVRSRQPDLVLMDVMMPGISGVDATKQILSGMQKGPAVVMLSGIRDEKVVLGALKAGAKEYLFKPIEPGKLKSVLWRLYKEDV